jgi:hypothetical protein
MHGFFTEYLHGRLEELRRTAKTRTCDATQACLYD